MYNKYCNTRNKIVILILHNIRSVFNVGSIFRTADAFGVKKIYLVGYTPDPAQKTALGAEKYVEYGKVKSIQKLIQELKENNFFIISLENRISGSVSIDRFFDKSKKSSRNKFNKHNHTALILGNEIRGIPKSVQNLSDVVIEIPMRGKKESLNVSIAAGIVLYALSTI